MAYDYTLITFGGGDMLQEIFHGIAAAMGKSAYQTILSTTSPSTNGYALDDSATPTA